MEKGGKGWRNCVKKGKNKKEKEFRPQRKIVVAGRVDLLSSSREIRPIRKGKKQNRRGRGGISGVVMRFKTSSRD